MAEYVFNGIKVVYEDDVVFKPGEINMGKKYIIELEDDAFTNKNNEADKLYRVKGFKSLVFDEDGLNKLEPYKLPKVKYDSMIAEAGEHGAEKAWELARHLFNVGEDPINNRFYRSRRDNKNREALLEMPYAKAVEEYEALKCKNKNAEIHIGDEVESTLSGKKGIVLSVKTNYVYGFYVTDASEISSFSWNRQYIKNTGRTFGSIQNIINMIKAEQ